MPTKGKINIARRTLKNTGYSENGASYGKASMAGWDVVRSSPTSDIITNLSTLRARSADLTMGAPIASSAINTSRTNVIGVGLSVSPKPKYSVLGITAKDAEQWARMVKNEFDIWASSKFCDIFKKNNFYDMQDIAYMSYLVDGDSFAAFKYRTPQPGMPYALRIQLFEGSRVCNPGTQGVISSVSPWMVIVQNPNNGNRIIDGVEVDSDGAVVAYWVCNKYLYDPTNMTQLPEWVRVDAFSQQTGQPNILQIGHDERPEQYRGVPYLAPVLESLKQVSRYTSAELTAAIIKAYFTVFFSEEVPNTGGAFPLNEGIKPRDKITLDPDKFELGPGSMNVLPPGYKVTSMDPQRSLSTFEPFTQALIKEIGAALEIPYEVLIKSFNSSYTASRAALLQAGSNFKMRRTWFARDFCQPVFEAWLAEAITIGRIKALGFFDDPLIHNAWCNTDWYGPVMGVLDPIKEVQGAALRVQYGISTREKETAEMTGTSWDENVERLAIEKQTMQRLGLPLETAVVPSSDRSENEQNGEVNKT